MVLLTIESKLNEIDNKIERLQQIQDFTAMQMTFLGISFALFIFMITTFITDVEPIFKLTSLVIFPYLILILYPLLISIFSNNWEIKLNNFIIVILIIILISFTIVVLSLIFGFSIWLTNSFEENNITFVGLILIVFVITFVLFFKYINPNLVKRFNLLYKMIKVKKPSGIFAVFEHFIQKRMIRIAFSLLIGIFLTFLTGLIETSTKIYGIPLSWLTFEYGSNFNNFIYWNFLIDYLLISSIIFIIITLYEYYLKESRKK